MKKLVINSLVVIFSLVIAFFITECLLRIILPKIEEASYKVENGDLLLRPDNNLLHTIIPGALGKYDKNGYKNFDLKDEYDIVALGDSHTHGTFNDNYDVSWPMFLSQKMDKTVYNMGVWGYGPAQFYSQMDKAISFSPDFILVGVYLGNDIFDAYNVVYHADGWDDFKTDSFVDDNPIVASDLKSTKIPFRKIRDYFRENSVFYKFLGDRTRILREKIGISSPRTIGTSDWTTNDKDASLIYNNANLKTVFGSGLHAKGVDLNDDNIKEGLRLTKVFFENIEQKAADNDIQVLWGFIPTKESVYNAVVGDLADDNMYFSDIVKNEKKIKEELSEFCLIEHMSCFDLLPPLQKALQDKKNIYPESWDTHPNENGYNIYADNFMYYLNEMVNSNQGENNNLK